MRHPLNSGCRQLVTAIVIVGVALVALAVFLVVT